MPRKPKTTGIQMLREEGQYPTGRVLEKALGRAFPAFSAFMERLEEPEYGLVSGWRYYADGKAWLCKITRKSKTILWLSVWEGSFRTGFYFTEASGSGIADLNVDARIIKAYKDNESIGRLKPLVMNISAGSQLPDLFRIIRYKLDQK